MELNQKNIAFNSFTELNINNNNLIILDNTYEFYEFIKNKTELNNMVFIEDSFSYNPFIHLCNEKYSLIEEIQMLAECLINYNEYSYKYGVLYDVKKYYIATLIAYLFETHIEQSIHGLCDLAKFSYNCDPKLKCCSNLNSTSITMKFYRQFKDALYIYNQLYPEGETIKECLYDLMYWENILSSNKTDDLENKNGYAGFNLFIENPFLANIIIILLPSILRRTKTQNLNQFIIAENEIPCKISLHDIAIAKDNNYYFSFQINNEEAYKKVYGGEWGSFCRLLNKQVMG